MRRLYLSDLHLADPGSRQFRGFTDLLQRCRDSVDEIYLLGDLCEVWIGDDDDDPLATALITTLRDAGRYLRIHIMAGNRDFLFGDAFAEATGARLIDDPHRLPDGILLTHGDAFCIDDTAYQATRVTLRSPAWRSEILRQPLEVRRALARSMRAESRATNANKPDNIMDINPGAVERIVTAMTCTVMIHGHTHRPGIHRTAWGTRFVLGAWDHCAWVLREAPGAAFSLECIPLPSA